MARDQKVKVRIEAQDRASGEIKKTQTSLQRLGSFIKSNLAASLLSATALIYGFVRALRATIKASAEQELAVRKLDAALSPLGDKAGAVSKELQEYAAALQQITSFGDETIIAGQALIASFTKNTEEIKGATKAALDLAAATGQSLQSAFLLLGRAAAGETSMLSRYGITLDEGIPKTEKFAAALVKINEQFGGQAQAQAETFAGRMSQLGNAFGDLQEAIGDSITQSDRATGALESMKGIIEGLIPLASRTGEIFSALGTTIWNLAIPLRAVAAVTKELTDVWLNLSGATDVVEGRAEVFERRAKSLGISVTELKKRLDAASTGINNVNTSLEKTDDAAEDAAGGVDTLKTSLEALATAYQKAVEGTTALGVATSVQLEAQIIKISQELYNQKIILGEQSVEYQRLADIAGAKIASLKGRIESLRDGLGDLKDTTKDTTDAMSGYTAAMNAAADATERETRATEENIGEKEKQARALSSIGQPLFPGLSGTSYSYTVAGTPYGGGTFVTGGTKRATVAADGRIIFV
jgi:ABC-type transporter Mla subunit MlaD